MRAIDLYSGIGGWHLGLKMAGIEVVAAYEWWPQAVNTYNRNFCTSIAPTDIRKMGFDSLPKDVDVVVGSPPCTEFSFANRGGNGDIAEGLKDVYRFLEIVEYLQPKFWAMENVPRVASILESEIQPGGKLHRFKDLFSVITVVNAADFGLPQARKRMIAGNFSLDLLNSYKALSEPMCLGTVLDALKEESITDPIYGTTIGRGLLTDQEIEAYLDTEEARMNREAKQYHPVYNVMNFPEQLDAPARTVTGTCTRVSRESIIVEDGESSGRYRRLTIRERATLQGFPITFQIYGQTHTDKMKMAGNAIPPVLTYFVANSMLHKKSHELTPIKKLGFIHAIPSVLPDHTKAEAACKRYPRNRRFRMAIPNLRFGSGMRFELVNHFAGDEVTWRVGFYFGTSKDIKSLDLNGQLAERVAIQFCDPQLNKHKLHLESTLGNLDPDELQASWNRTVDGKHPFEVLDALGDTASKLYATLCRTYSQATMRQFITDLLLEAQKEQEYIYTSAKIGKTAVWVLTGILVGLWYNKVYASLKRPTTTEMVG